MGIRNSRRLKRLKSTTREETKDFISELPDHILVHILSFLPTRDAIKTVLLRRFGNLWRSVPVLDLNECLDCGCMDIESDREFGCIIEHVSNLHNVGILDKLSLNFTNFWKESTSDGFYIDLNDHAEMEEEATTCHIKKLVDYALSRKVKVLSLKFEGCDFVRLMELFVLPDVFRSNYLTDIRLGACNIESCREISLKALRVLSLDDVVLSDDIMESILLGCPILEDLSLISCYGLNKLYCRNPKLKKLMLSLNLSVEMLHVSCPHVMSLEIAGRIWSATLLDVTSLMDASISYFCIYTYKGDDLRRLLQKISRCQTLTTCDNSILMLTMCNFRNVPSASYQLKNLIIKLDLTKWHLPGLCWLLKSCLFLETLTMYICPGTDSFAKAVLPYPNDVDGECYWDVQEASFPCLESIKIQGYINKPYVDKMFMFLLKNATKLQRMVISTGMQKQESSSCQVLKLKQELSSFPRASSGAMIYVS